MKNQSYDIVYNDFFIDRVYPHASLKDLRDLVEEQLDHDVVPEDYVFLRSVGRCLAIVSLTLFQIFVISNLCILESFRI